ncbi:hypothetical protein BJ165DRAFT_344404 [Panaeolus papilionaceus]|nr:hypothetical protein BJ165DRAFT_344404 [Panaeolus papilionaceus]
MTSRTGPKTPIAAAVRNEESGLSEVQTATARELLRQPEKLIVTSTLPPFWSTKRGRAIMVLIVLVVIGAVVGGAIGGAKGNGGPERNNPASGPTPPGRTKLPQNPTPIPKPASSGDPVDTDLASVNAARRSLDTSSIQSQSPPLITPQPVPRMVAIRHASGLYNAETILAYATQPPSY